MWPSIITIDDFLDAEQLRRAQDLVAQADFVDGAVTAAGGNLSVKRNQEMNPGQGYVEVVKMVEQAVKSNDTIRYQVFPRTMTRPIISRYDDGMHYGEHIDSPVMGLSSQGSAMGPLGQNLVRSDFSMTVFLSDPANYQGGELTFGTPHGDHTYKLAAGSAVCYPTGLPHQVTPVSNGVRTAVVLWMQSIVHDHESRTMIADLYHLADLLETASPGSREAKLARECASNALRINASV